MVLLCEVRPEQQQAREVKFAGSNVLEHHGKSPSDPSRLRSAERGVFGHAKLVLTIGGEARASALAMNATRLDFREVSQERGEQLIGAADQTTDAGVELLVGDAIEAAGQHGRTLYRGAPPNPHPIGAKIRLRR